MLSWLENRIPPVILTAVFAVLMWLLSQATPSTSLPAGPKTLVLIILAGAGLAIAAAGVFSFRKARTTVNPLNPGDCSSLVVSGVFRWTRNPMYLGLLLWLIAWALFLSNIYTLLLIAVWFAYLNRFQIEPEERALESAFGAGFIDYRKRVRRWL